MHWVSRVDDNDMVNGSKVSIIYLTGWYRVPCSFCTVVLYMYRSGRVCC